MSKGHYPGFDVLDQKEAWDEHTRAIVMKRLEAEKAAPAGSKQNLRSFLMCLAGHLLYDDREEVLAFVASHIEERMAQRDGESQRKRGVPPEDRLITSGLKGLNDVAELRYGQPFLSCDAEQQFDLLRNLQHGSLEATGAMSDVPQKELFNKLLTLSTEAYASYPQVWSEMGYAGPAYPRGYYRIEQGLHDPWEPSHANRPTPNGTSEEDAL